MNSCRCAAPGSPGWTIGSSRLKCECGQVTIYPGDATAGVAVTTTPTTAATITIALTTLIAPSLARIESPRLDHPEPGHDGANGTPAAVRWKDDGDDRGDPRNGPPRPALRPRPRGGFYENVHVGVARRAETVDLVPGDAVSARGPAPSARARRPPGRLARPDRPAGLASVRQRPPAGRRLDGHRPGPVSRPAIPPEVVRLAEDSNAYQPLGPDEERVVTDRYVLFFGSIAHPAANAAQRLRLDPANVDSTVREVRSAVRHR